MKTELSKLSRAFIVTLLFTVSAISVITFTDCTGKSKKTSEEVYSQVDSMPVFPGGDNALLKYIADNANYPEESKKNNVTGRVLVKFVVHKDCHISDVIVEKSIDPLLDTEALRVVRSLPKFEKPGIRDGKAVNVEFIIPITFSLK